MTPLANRIYVYLQRRGSGQWVSRAEIIALCNENQYKTQHAMKSLEEILALPDIGYIYKDGGAQYCWYYMTDEELERNKLQRELWESLP